MLGDISKFVYLSTMELFQKRSCRSFMEIKGRKPIYFYKKKSSSGRIL